MTAFVPHYLVLGAFGHGDESQLLLHPFIDEPAAAPAADEPHGPLRWRREDAGADGVLNLLGCLSDRQTYAAAYAFVYVHVEAACEARLEVSSDDGVAVWLNGAEVWRNDTQRGVASAVDRIEGRLEAGWNRLLCKVSQYEMGWALRVSVTASPSVRFESRRPVRIVPPAGGAGDTAIRITTEAQARRLAADAQRASNPAALRRAGRTFECAVRLYRPALAPHAGKIEEGRTALQRGKFAVAARALRSLVASVTCDVPDRSHDLVQLVGHAHIDMDWLWPHAETLQTVNDTWRQALAFMDEYPEFVFLQSQPGVYAEIEREEPALFERIRQRVDEGRWELVGGFWTESDTNLPSGEALARSLLLGQRYFLARFGRTAAVGWQPDSFGHAAQLPQLLRLAGCRSCFITRCAPHLGTFRWQAPDGSSIVCFANTGYGLSISPDLAARVDRLVPVQRRMLHPFGVGDHGGGPTRRDLEQLRLLRDAPRFPTLRSGGAEAYFEEASAALPQMPTHRGEMQYVFEGCYTTLARIKEANRACEAMLGRAEFLAMQGWFGGRPYPADELRQAWHAVAFNQFHDILCGTSIHESNTEALARYATTLETATSVGRRAFRQLADEVRVDLRRGQPLVVANTTPRRQSTLVEAEVFSHGLPAAVRFCDFTQPEEAPFVRLRDAHAAPVAGVCLCDRRGASIPAQIVWGKQFPPGYRWRLLCRADDLPAGGYRTLYVDPSRPGVHGPIPERGGVFETDDLRVAFDLQTGLIRRLTDKRTSKQWVARGATLNELTVRRERPPAWWSAWTLGPVDETFALTAADSVRITERGPVRACVEARRRWGRSTFVQRTYIYRSYPRIDFELEVDWLETGSEEAGVPALRVAFPLAVQRPVFTCQTPFAAVARPANGQEVPALQWVDVQECDGMALLTRSKHGFRLDGGTLELALLRASYHPDPRPDLGPHTIRYALFPHAGDWRQGRVWNESELFQAPPTGIEPPSMALGRPNATRPDEAALLTLDPPALAFGGVKLAEEGDELVIRFAEVEGRRTVARVRLPVEVKSVRRLDLTERPLADAPVPRATGRVVRLSVRPHEIVTLGIGRK